MEQVTLKDCVKAFCLNKKDCECFKYYLKRSLQNTGNQKTILREGECVEIVDGLVVISFTWDNITATNMLTHKYVDMMCPENAFEVFD